MGLNHRQSLICTYSADDLRPLMLTFDDVGLCAKEKSGCSSASKAYKYMAEPGYLHDIKGNIN